MSGRFVKDVLLRFHAQRHQTTDGSDNEDSDDTSGDSGNEDSDDALDGDEVKATDAINPKTNDFRNGENVDIEGGVDPHEGIVSDWEILMEEFIVRAEELGKFEPSFLHTL